MFFGCLLANNVKAQGEGQLAKEDSNYVNALNSASVNLYLNNPDSSRALAEKALITATRLKYGRGIGEGYAAIGYSYFAQAFYSLSLYYLFGALNSLNGSGDYGQLSMCNRIVARDYIEMEQYKPAARYLDTARQYADLSKNEFVKDLVYNEATLLDFKEERYAQAWQKGMTAIQLCKKNKDTLLTGIIYSRLSNILKARRQTDSLKKYYDTAYQWASLSKNNRLRALLMTHFSELHLAAGHKDSALYYAKNASALADSIGNMDLKIIAANLIARIYETSGDVATELQYRRLYNKVQDSISGVVNKKNFGLITQFFSLSARLQDVQEQEHINIINKERIGFQRVTITVLVIFIAILLAGLFTIYFLYSEKNRLARQLVEKNSAVTAQKNIIEDQSQHLAELNNIKTKLFAVISHDLRTPISSLRSIMGMFQQNDLSEEQAIGLLKKMLPALDGADLTLSNLLNWSVKQMNGLKVNRANVPVLTMADEMQKVFEFALQQKNITLEVAITADCRALCDEQHLKIVLRNLVSNAVKFTQQNGRIVIGNNTDKKGKTVIYIKDNGQGIKSEDLAKLFVPTAHFTTRGTGGEKGTGLGLVLCKELLELNDGSIRVDTSPGNGSTFFIELQEKES